MPAPYPVSGSSSLHIVGGILAKLVFFFVLFIVSVSVDC